MILSPSNILNRQMFDSKCSSIFMLHNKVVASFLHYVSQQCSSIFNVVTSSFQFVGFYIFKIYQIVCYDICGNREIISLSVHWWQCPYFFVLSWFWKLKFKLFQETTRELQKGRQRQVPQISSCLGLHFSINEFFSFFLRSQLLGLARI